jgi:hypothetical protein
VRRFSHEGPGLLRFRDLKSRQRTFIEEGLAEGEELGSNILQLGGAALSIAERYCGKRPAAAACVSLARSDALETRERSGRVGAERGCEEII